MIKFISGFITATVLIALYLNTISIPEYILQFECRPEPVRKPPATINII